MEPFSYEIIQLLNRWYALRKIGKCVPLIQIWNKLYTYDSVGRWESKMEISVERLRELVEVEEIKRKSVGKEKGEKCELLQRYDTG